MNKLVIVLSNGHAETSEDGHSEKAEADNLAEGGNVLSTRFAVTTAR